MIHDYVFIQGRSSNMIYKNSTISAVEIGGAIHSYGQITILIKHSRFLGNKAGSSGGVLQVEMGGSLHSQGNVYEGNIAPQGSVIMSAGSVIRLGQSKPDLYKYTKVTMIGDTFSNNIGGVFQATYLSEMLVDSTRFVNNTSTESMPGILIGDFVIKFTCSNVDFILNRGKFDGVILIHSALNVTLDAIIVKSNNVLFGKMIEVKHATDIAVIKSDFENNYCTSTPCALSVEHSDNTDIDSCTFLSTILNDSGESMHSAVDIRGKHINMKRMHFYGLESRVVTGVPVQSMSVHDVSYSCPENHYFHTYLTNISPENKNRNGSITPASGISNEYPLKLECIMCAKNQYRVDVSSHTISKFYSDPTRGYEERMRICD